MKINFSASRSSVICPTRLPLGIKHGSRLPSERPLINQWGTFKNLESFILNHLSLSAAIGTHQKKQRHYFSHLSRRFWPGPPIWERQVISAIWRLAPWPSYLSWWFFPRLMMPVSSMKKLKGCNFGGFLIKLELPWLVILLFRVIAMGGSCWGIFLPLECFMLFSFF